MLKYLLVPTIGLFVTGLASAQESASWYDAIQGVQYPVGEETPVDPTRCAPSTADGTDTAEVLEESGGPRSRESRFAPPGDGRRGPRRRGPRSGGGGPPPTEEERAAHRARIEARLAAMTTEERAEFEAQHEARRAEFEARRAKRDASGEERQFSGAGDSDSRVPQRPRHHRRPPPPPHPDSGDFRQWTGSVERFPGAQP